jgi:hypothetical protein
VAELTKGGTVSEDAVAALQQQLCSKSDTLKAALAELETANGHLEVMSKSSGIKDDTIAHLTRWAGVHDRAQRLMAQHCCCMAFFCARSKGGLLQGHVPGRRTALPGGTQRAAAAVPLMCSWLASHPAVQAGEGAGGTGARRCAAGAGGPGAGRGSARSSGAGSGAKP